MPFLTASSKLFVDVAVISTVLATDILTPLGYPRHIFIVTCESAVRLVFDSDEAILMCETAHSTSSEKTPGSTGQRFSGVPFSHMAFNRFDLLGGLGDPDYLMFFMDPIFIMENTILLGTEFDKKFDKKTTM
jgi:hypothetical protein